MKKHLLFSFVLSTLAIGAIAAPRDRAAALRLAQQAASAQGATISQPNAAKAYSPAASSTSSPYYIFDKDNSQGFVVVSGDDRMPDILGYTDSGSFDEANMSKGMRFMLKAYQKTAEGLQKGNKTVIARLAEVKKRKANVTTTVGPLMESKWSQYSPFNAYCPTITVSDSRYASMFSGHAAAGCVPIALSQVMYYHKWPKTLKTTLPAYTTSTQGYKIDAVPAGTEYEWDKMQPTYSGSGSLNAMKACGTLLVNVGQSLRADYNDQGDGETGADFEKAPLVTYFDYDNELMSQQYRVNYTLDAWNELITNEIVNSRPVAYEAYSKANEELSLYEGEDGHAFVLDGVNPSGLYHVNFGWAGTDDGWYDIDAMVGDDITWSVDADCVIGMVPNNGRTDDTPLYSLLSLSNGSKSDRPSLSIDGTRTDEDEDFTGTIHYVFSNSNSMNFSGYVRLAVIQYGQTQYISQSQSLTCAAGQRASADFKFSYAFPVGTTVIYAMISYDGQNWMQALDNNLYAYEVTATEKTLTGSGSPLSVSVTLGRKSDSYDNIVMNKTYLFIVTVKNTSKVRTLPNHYLDVHWQNNDNYDDYGELAYPDGAEYLYTGDIAPGDSVRKVCTYRPTKAGTFYIYAYDEMDVTSYTQEFNVLDPASINGIKLDDDDALRPWYTISGARLQDEPAQPGVYVRGGKKIIKK